MEDLALANMDIMTIFFHAKKTGWDTIMSSTVHRFIYLSKVLYSFVDCETQNLFDCYHFNITTYGPYSQLINNSLTFLLSCRCLEGELNGELSLNSTSGVNLIDEEKRKWIDTILLILSKYGESKVFGFIINDPLYDISVKSNQQSEIQVLPENETLLVLNEFKRAFEDTMPSTLCINKEEYIGLYFDYVFSQIIKTGNE